MKSYKPKIDEKEAKELLTLRGRIFRSRKTPPVRVELIYLPYYFFRIRIRNKRGEEREFMAGIDAITKSFVLVDEKGLEQEELSWVEFQPAISEEEARNALLKEARWFLYEKSLMSRDRYKLVDYKEMELVWYPYWVGYYRSASGSWDFLALDAISGILQGGKARRIFILAFSQVRVK